MDDWEKPRESTISIAHVDDAALSKMILSYFPGLIPGSSELDRIH